MAPVLRTSFAFIAAATLRCIVASRPKEEAPVPEVTLEGVAALLGKANKAGYMQKAQEELSENEGMLLSLLNVVPNGEGDRFSAPAVRFALHKHFVRQYGWHMKGLEPAGGSWNSSSPVEAVIFQRLPVTVRSLFERRLQDGGLLAREVAVLAATMELLVHVEAGERLRGIMRMLNMKTGGEMTKQDELKVRQWYMTSYMLGKNPWKTGRLDLKTLVGDMPSLFPAWPKVMEMIEDISIEQLDEGQPAKRPSVPYDDVQDTVEEIGHRFGPWQNFICADLKSSLIELNDAGIGRVALSDFYKAGLEGKWQFQESAEYMKKSGSLDTSNPSSPRVIIPNWVNSPSNCLGTSETHDVCCISECEPILAQVERAVGAPTATPDQIAEIVVGISSSTMPAGRELPVLLRNRLQAVAAAHEGVVPLNSRLFAQWMHHAYPRECPYPHLTGATAPVNVFAWEAEHKGELPLASEAAMHEQAEVKRRSNEPVLSAPWESQEEMLVETVHHSTPPGAAFVHLAVALSAGCVALLGLVRTAASAVRKAAGRGEKVTMSQRAIYI